MKKKIIINYTFIGLCIIASIALCAYIMISKLSLENMKSLDILIVVGTPFVLLLLDLAIAKACLNNIKNVKEFIKIPLENRNDVITVGKNYRISNDYTLRISISIAFFSFIGFIVLFVLFFMNKVEALYGIGGGVILILIAIISFFIYLYSNKLSKFDDYNLGKRYILSLKESKKL